MKCRSMTIVLVLFTIGARGLSAEEDQYVRFNPEYTYRMLDHTTDINRKQLLLLKQREAGLLEDQQMYLGANMNVLADTQHSNTDSKFGYLMRHPTQNNQTGNTVSEMVIHNAQLQVTGTLTPWASMYFQVLYDPQQSFGSGTITDLERNELSLRRGYVLLGDLSTFPIYASLGKMATPFGLTDSVNPFTASTVWHAFGGLAYGGLIGYYDHGLNISFMGIQGGAQFRATHSGDDTPDDVGNYTVNASYEFSFSEQGSRSLLVGGGYVDGSAYCQSFPVVHFNECDDFQNPAWDVYSLLRWDRLTVIGEVARTTDEWPATHNPNPPLDVFETHDVSAFDIGAKYIVPLGFISKDLGISADFSKFIAGPSGSPWEEQSQFVTGLDIMWNEHTKIFAEYIRTEGYVPLNFISGPDPFDPSENPGTTHSVSDASSDVILVGLRVAI